MEYFLFIAFGWVGGFACGIVYAIGTYIASDKAAAIRGMK